MQPLSMDYIDFCDSAAKKSWDETKCISESENIFRLVDNLVNSMDISKKPLECHIKFIHTIFDTVIPSIHSLGYIDSEYKEIFVSYFCCFLKLGIWVTKLNDTDGIKIISESIPSNSWKIVCFNENFDLFENVSNYFIEQNFDQCLYNVLQEGPSNMSTAISIVKLLDELIAKINSFDISDVFISIVEYLVKRGSESIRNIVPEDVMEIYNFFSFSELSNKAVSEYFDVLFMMASCNIFDRQLMSYQLFSKIINNKKEQAFLIEWFNADDHVSILAKKDAHPELMMYIGNICVPLLKSGVIDFDFVSGQWSLNGVIHTSHIKNFYDMFLTVADGVPDEMLVDFANMCLNPAMKTHEWFSFFEKLAENLVKKDVYEVIELVTDFMWETAFSDSEFASEAKECLKNILAYNVTPESMRNLIERVADIPPSDFVSILGPSVKKCSLNDKSVIQTLIQKAFIVLKNADSKSEALNFIYNILLNNELPVPDQFMDLINNIGKCKELYIFIKCLYSKHLIRFDQMICFLKTVREEDIDNNFVNMLKNFVNYEIPLNGTTKVPIQCEDIIWHLVCLDSPSRNSIINILVSIYMKNDPKNLPDDEMLDKFIEKWQKEFIKSKKNPFLIDVLRKFVNKAEKNVDYENYSIIPHSYEISPKVNVYVYINNNLAHEFFDLPSNITVGVISQKIAKKECSKQCYTFKQELKDVSSSTKLNKLNVKKNTIKLNAIASSKKKNIYPREWTYLPSEQINKTSIPSMLLQLLSENCNEAKNLLERLPTVKSIKQQIEDINSGHNTDISAFLPKNNPPLLVYNLESLEAYDNICSEAENMIVEYLIDSIPLISSYALNEVMDYLNDHIDNDNISCFAQKILDNFLKKVDEYHSKGNIGQIKKICQYLSSFLKSCPGITPSSYFYSIAENILSESDYEVIEATKDVFDLISFSQDFIIEAIKRSGDSTKSILFDILEKKIIEFNEDLFNIIIETIDSNSSWIKSALICMEKMLKFDSISEEALEKLCQSIMNSFFSVDNIPNQETYAIVCRISKHFKIPLFRNHLEKLIEMSKNSNQWNVDGDVKPKSPAGAGLINLGATCFLDSTLQQFFAISPLKKAVIEYNGVDVFMIELKNLFARMELSNEKTLSTSNLVDKWVGWDGEKMDPLTQQDACEFIQNLLDKLEKGIGVEFVKELFQGTIIHHTEGINEEYHTESSEPFYTFPLQVKGISNMDEALEKFAAPDFFIGNNQYNAEELGHKIDARRYNEMGNAPQYLIIQLERFEYNYQNWSRIKIDSRFDFPFTLKLKEPYKLAGIIVHIGTANYGHYISYISIKDTDKWKLCNDESISIVTKEEVLEASRGSNPKSAYILFYEREDADVICKPKVSEEVRNFINEQNMNLALASILYSSPFFKLMKDFSSEISIKYYFDIIPRSILLNRASSLSSNICQAMKYSDDLKEYFFKVLIEKTAVSTVLYSKNLTLAEGALNMIKVAVEKCSYETLKELFNYNEYAVKYYSNIDTFFKAIGFIVNKCDYASRCIKNDWQHTLCSIITVRLQDKLNENKSECENYNLSSLLELITILAPIPEPTKACIATKEFFIIVCKSKTKLKFFTKLLEACSISKDVFNEIIISCGNDINYIKKFELIISLIKENIFDTWEDYHVKINSIEAKEIDWYEAFTYVINKCDIRSMFMNNIEIWMPKILSKSENMRKRVLTMIGSLVRTKPFSNANIYRMAYTTNLSITFEDTEETKKNAKRLFLYFNDNIIYYSETLRECYNEDPTIAKEFVSSISKLGESLENKEDYSSLLNIILKVISDFCIKNDPNVKTILECLNSIGKVVDVLPFFKQIDSSNSNDASDFLKVLMLHLKEENITESFAHDFFEMFAAGNQKVFFPYAEKIAKIQKVVARDFILSTKWEPNIFPKVLSIAKAAEIKIDIMEAVCIACKDLSNYDASDLVYRALEVDNRNSVTIDMLNELVENDKLMPYAKKKVTELRDSMLEEENCKKVFPLVRKISENLNFCKESDFEELREIIEKSKEGLPMDELKDLYESIKDNGYAQKLSKAIEKLILE